MHTKVVQHSVSSILFLLSCLLVSSPIKIALSLQRFLLQSIAQCRMVGRHALQHGLVQHVHVTHLDGDHTRCAALVVKDGEL